MHAPTISVIAVVCFSLLSQSECFQTCPGLKPNVAQQSALCARPALQSGLLRRNKAVPLRVAVGGGSETKLAEEQAVAASRQESPLLALIKNALASLMALWQTIIATFLSLVEEAKLFFAKIGLFFSNLFKGERSSKEDPVQAAASTPTDLEQEDLVAAVVAKAKGIDISTATMGVAAVPAAVLALSALGDAATMDMAITAAQGAAAVVAVRLMWQSYTMDMATATFGAMLGTSDAAVAEAAKEDAEKGAQ